MFRHWHCVKNCSLIIHFNEITALAQQGSQCRGSSKGKEKKLPASPAQGQDIDKDTMGNQDFPFNSAEYFK